MQSNPFHSNPTRSLAQGCIDFPLLPFDARSQSNYTLFAFLACLTCALSALILSRLFRNRYSPPSYSSYKSSDYLRLTFQGVLSRWKFLEWEAEVVRSEGHSDSFRSELDCVQRQVSHFRSSWLRLAVFPASDRDGSGSWNHQYRLRSLRCRLCVCQRGLWRSIVLLGRLLL